MKPLRGWKPILRVTASVAMLGILLTRIDLRALRPEWDTGAALWLAAAIAATLAGIVLSALRWQRVLAALDVDTGIRPLVSHYLASLFVGNFLPSTIGGDVLRVSRLSTATGESPRPFASVVLERLTGWIVLPLLTLMALAVNPGLRELGRATQLAATVAIVTLVLLAGLLVMAASPRLGGRLKSNDGWRRFTGAIHLGLDRFRRHPGMAVEVLTVGFAYQLAVMLAAFLASEAMGLDVGWTAVLAFFPAVAIVQVLPVTIGGLGMREGALVLFLHPLGITTEQAIALGLVVYAINLVVSLLGAPAFAVGHGRPARVTA